jgi:hypothetical protein
MLGWSMNLLSYPFLIPTVVASGFAVRIKKDGVAATITDDREVPSVQHEAAPFVLGDKLPDGFTHLCRYALLVAFHKTLRVSACDDKG